MCDIYNTYAFIYITSIQLRNICITKKCVFNNFEKYRTLLLQRL